MKLGGTQLKSRRAKVQEGKRLGIKRSGAEAKALPRAEVPIGSFRKTPTPETTPEAAYFLSSFFSSFGFNASAGMLAFSLTKTASEMSFSPLLNRMIGTWLMDSAAVSMTRL